jgi:hypothetical protein
VAPTPAPRPTATTDLGAKAPSGDVTVTLPTGEVVSVAQLRSIPIGSVVDTRKGRIDLTAKKASLRVRAGLFQIRQNRAKATEIALVSAAGATAPCKRAGPATGTVRSLDVAAKGIVRVVAGAAVLTPSGSASTWTTTDRSDGTLVTVAKGRVLATVTKGRQRTMVVRAGHSYLVKARLFAARRAK